MVRALLFVVALLSAPAQRLPQPPTPEEIARIVAADKALPKLPPTKPCPTTLDGLPMCPQTVEMSTAQCLTTFPPDEVGGFCTWYGYAAVADVVAFERARGFEFRPYDSTRPPNPDGTGDWWAVTPYAKALVACRWAVYRMWPLEAPYGPDFRVLCR